MLGFWILICHLVGDYTLQSEWMAQNKTKAWWPAIMHALLYSLCFLPFFLSWHYPTLVLRPFPLYVIFVSHLFIDHCRLARYVVWAKNWLFSPPAQLWGAFLEDWKPAEHWTPADLNRLGIGPDDVRWHWGRTPPFDCCPTGYPPNTPAWMAVWLLIIADNTIHLLIAGLAITYL